MFLNKCRIILKKQQYAKQYSRFFSSSFTHYIDKGIIHINITNENNSSPLLSLLGPGNRLKESIPSPLDNLNYIASEEDILNFVEEKYEHDTPVDIVFDNMIGEPTLEMEKLITIGRSIKERRHGVPLTINTNGLSGSAGAEQLFEMDPGDNTGLKNLHLSVLLPANNPPKYNKLMKNTDPSSFGQVCSFLVSAIELLGGEYVTCMAIDAPGADINGIRALTTSLGVSNLEILPYESETLYDKLNLSAEKCDEKEIKNTFHQLAKKLHPDINPDGREQFEHIKHAYKILIDKDKRKQYDEGSWEYLSSRI